MLLTFTSQVNYKGMCQELFSLKIEGLVYTCNIYRKTINCVKHAISRKVIFLYHINIMQIRSRDLQRPQRPKKSLIKNGSSLIESYST